MKRMAAGERGSGTVLAAGGIGAVLVLLAGLLTVASAMVAAHRARAAADLSALAAAGRLAEVGAPDPACALAARVADANGAVLLSCQVDGPQVMVRVAREWSLGFALALPHTAESRARAGPDPGGGDRAEVEPQ